MNILRFKLNSRCFVRPYLLTLALTLTVSVAVYARDAATTATTKGAVKSNSAAKTKFAATPQASKTSKVSSTNPKITPVDAVSGIPIAIDNDLAKRVDAVVDKAIANQKIVGAVVMVARDGKIVYQRAIGYNDRESKVPMRQDAIFRLASMSKPIVSEAALALVQRGKLKLSDPVTKYLPDFRPKLADGTTPEITIAQLLNHTSGLGYSFSEKGDGPYHRAKVSDGMDQPGLSMAENMKRLASVPLYFKPGTKWRYSLSIDVLGAVLEKAAGKPLADVVAEMVTGPLSMKDTDFKVVDVKRLTVPYYDGKPKPLKMQPFQLVPVGDGAFAFAPDRCLNLASFPSGGAGLVGTANDYLKFLESLRTANGAGLKPEFYKLMAESQTGNMDAGSGPDWGFSYGAAVLLHPDKKQGPHNLGTRQWGGAYGHHWFIDPVSKLSVVELSNTTTEGMAGEYTRELSRAIYGSAK
jgi:CubicO group peptidase (beta-lactamase class C family)